MREIRTIDYVIMLNTHMIYFLNDTLSILSMIGSQLLVGNIKVLLLANNSIRNVKGLDRLYSLEKLDLRSNKISNVSDVSALAKLPQLMELNVAENPFTSNGEELCFALKLLTVVSYLTSILLNPSREETPI